MLNFKMPINFSRVGTCIVIFSLIAISVTDYKKNIIPDYMCLSLFIGAVFDYIQEIINNGFVIKALTNRIVGSLVISIFLLLLALITNGGIGGGDIKMTAAAGFLLGVPYILVAFFISYLFAALFVFISGGFKRNNMKNSVPIGPYLSMGILVTMYFGEKILQWFLI